LARPQRRRSGNPSRARAFYEKPRIVFPSRILLTPPINGLAKLAPGTPIPPDRSRKFPLRRRSPFDEPIAPSSPSRWNRAQALRTIAFDSSAETELKAAYAATASPRYLVEAAQAAFDQVFRTGMAYGRLAVPISTPRKLSDVLPVFGKYCFLSL